MAKVKTKIGRNDVCGCGSGLKFKKCCLPKGFSYFKKENKEVNQGHNFSIKQFFGKYNYIDLASFFATLSLNILNHGKSIRLDFLTLAALYYGNKKVSENLDLSLIKKFLNSKYRFHAFEDPVETFFNRNICYHNGNAIVYQGIFTNGPEIIQNQIAVINAFKDSFSNDFINESKAITTFFLEISTTLGIRFGHDRNMFKDWANIPSEIIIKNERSETYKLWFENEQIESLCKFCKIDLSEINEFCIKLSDINVEELLIENNNINPLLTKPFIRTKEGICVLSPTNLLICLVHTLWVKSFKNNSLENFILKYHSVVITDLIETLLKLGYNFISNSNEQENKDSLPSYLIFEFDSDKILLIAIQYDMLSGYDINNIMSENNVNLSFFSEHEIDQFVDQNQKLFDNKDIQKMCVVSSTGRSVGIQSDVRGKCLIGTAYDILIILNSDIKNGLDIWYYLKVKEQFSKTTEFSPYNTSLDRYAIYYSKKSFYMSDEKKPSALAIISDGNFNVLKHGVFKKERINALYISDVFNYPVYLPVDKYNDYVKRYYNLHTFANRLEFWIPNWEISIWVKSIIKTEDIAEELKNTYWEYCEAICFWLAEIGESMKEIINSNVKLLPKVIDVYFSLINPSIPSSREVQNDELNLVSIKSSISISINENGFVISIPEKLWEVAIMKDNTADRLLIYKLLIGFQTLLSNYSISLSDEQIQNIIEKHAPLGLKKYLLIMSSGDNLAFDNRFLKIEHITLFSDSNYEWYLENLISYIGKNCPPLGQLVEKDIKLKLCKNITIALAKEISDILKSHNSMDLLKDLITRYEVTMHHNELYRFRIPTLLHCYQDKWNIVDEIKETAQNNDKSSLALRCLIEYVASENYRGIKPVTTESIDNLLSLLNLLNFFGNFHDIIEFDLFETKMSILDSGRIGTNWDEIESNFMEKLLDNKAMQLIQESTDYYYSDEEHYTNKFVMSETLLDKLSEAFLEDHKISFSNLISIIDFLKALPFELETDVAKVEKSILIDKIFSHFSGEIINDQIISALDFLSLKNRNGMLNKLPPGFDISDVFPWKFNRRLSYLYKPLVECVDENKKEFILYSPRHLDKSFAFLGSKLSNGQFKGIYKGKVASVVGEIAKIKGKNLQQEIVDFFSVFENIEVFEEFNIKTDPSFDANADLGDIDVVVFDQVNNVVLCIESKNTVESKNMKEFAQEADDYLGENGYIFKHKRRHQWASKNLQRLGNRYNVNTDNFVVLSLMITKYRLAIQFMNDRKIDFPIFTLKDFKNKDLHEIISDIKQIGNL